MVNQDNLPIWARILLGIPVREAESEKGGEVDGGGSDSERRSESREAGPNDQDAMVFQRVPEHGKRRWQILLRPVGGEF